MSNIFIDSANLEEIEEVLKRGFASGITTNPSIIAKEPKTDFIKHINKIADLCNKYNQNSMPLSVEVFSRDTIEIVKQANEMKRQINHPGLNIKIQVGWNELEAIRILKTYHDIKINCTACMDVSQAALAAHAGADFVSIFWGRINDWINTSDTSFSGTQYVLPAPGGVVKALKDIIIASDLHCKIIVGSIRSTDNIVAAMKSGTDIVTIPYKFLRPMTQHDATDKVVNQFFETFGEWLKSSTLSMKQENQRFDVTQNAQTAALQEILAEEILAKHPLD